MPDSLPNLQVRIFGLRPVRGQEYAHYPVEAELDDGSRFRGTLDPIALDRLPSPSDSEAYGSALFDTLFWGGIRDAYNQALGRVRGGSPGRVRLRLWIEDAAAELHAIPWEKLHRDFDGTKRPLVAGDVSLLFSRYLGLQRPETQPLDLTDGPLRVLYAISNPVTLPPGLPPIDVDAEVSAILDVLGDLQQRRQVEATFLPGRTPLSGEVEQRLRDFGCRDVPDSAAADREVSSGCRIVRGATTWERFGRELAEHHVVHFLGHGRFLRENPTGPGTAALYFESDGGSYARVLDQQIVQLLQTIDPKPRLFFLAACESAVTQSSEEHPHVGLAPQLIAAGIPAVVAMQDLVTMTAARQLTARFYRGLLEHGVLDRALLDARTSLLSLGAASEEWAKPVVLMRLQEGQLFTGTAHEVLHRMRSSSDMRLFQSKSYIDISLEVLYLTSDQVLTNLERLPPDTVASVDLMATVAAVFRLGPGEHLERKRLLAIVGSPGTNKTTQAKRIAWRRIQRSLGEPLQGSGDEERALPTVVPIYVSLTDFGKSIPGQPVSLEALALQSLKQYWPDLGSLPRERPVLRFLFDDAGNLTDQDRDRVRRDLLDLMERYPDHQYVLATRPGAYDWDRFAKEVDLHVLLIQPLDRRKIRHILEVGQGADTEPNAILLDSLYRSDLFDIARTPSFLARFMLHAQRGRSPASRGDAIWGILEDEVLDLSPGHDTRTQVEETLFRLAWDMKRGGSSEWPLERVFGIMAEVRGRRGYDLESLYNAILDHGILAWAGAETIRFNYPLIEDYCCARAIAGIAQRDRVLRDVIATLGVPEWLNWWQEVLVFLSGLMTSEPTGLRRLLEALVYGLDPLKGEHIFLAARCLLEAAQSSQRSDPDLRSLLDEMIPYVTNVLRWRIDAEANPLWEQRSRAVHLLGALAGPDAAVELTRIAIGKPRRGSGRGRAAQPKHEISGVRLAAATELSRMPPEKIRQALKDAGPALAQQIPEWKDDPDELIKKVVSMVREWQRRDVEALKARFVEEDESLRAIAAFALGDLQSLNALAARETTGKPTEGTFDHRGAARSLLSVLEKAFLDPIKPESVGWALAEALSLLDTLTVIRIIRPALEQPKRPLQQDWFLAYLIGAIRPPPGRFPEGRRFLRECINPRKELKLVGIAVDALAALRDPEDEKLLRDFAMGERADESSAPYLRVARRKAIEALRTVGSLETIRQLREQGVDRIPELRDAFYETSRAIYWRTNSQRG